MSQNNCKFEHSFVQVKCFGNARISATSDSFAAMDRLADFIHKYWSNVWVKGILVLIVLLFVFIEANGGRNDLDIFLNASQDLFRGENIYENTYYDGYHYYYSVLFATLIYPLSLLGSFWSKWLWISFQLLLLWRIWMIMIGWLGTYLNKPALKSLLGFCVLVFCLRFVRSNLHLCQMTIMMLFLSLESINMILKRRWILGSMLLAFAINIKLMPLVLLPYLFYRAQWKAAIMTLFMIGAMLYLPILWLGKDQHAILLHGYFDLINPTQSAHVLDASETSFHSLTTFFAVFFSEDAHENGAQDWPRNLASLQITQLNILINVVRLALIVFTLWFLRSLPFKSFDNNEHTWWEISYLLLLVPLIFPHQQHYAFFMCLPAVGWIFYQLIQKKFVVSPWILGFLILVFLCFNLSLWLGAFNKWYNHFKLVTFGGLALLFVLAKLLPGSLSISRSEAR